MCLGNFKHRFCSSPLRSSSIDLLQVSAHASRLVEDPIAHVHRSLLLGFADCFCSKTLPFKRSCLPTVPLPTRTPSPFKVRSLLLVPCSAVLVQAFCLALLSVRS